MADWTSIPDATFDPDRPVLGSTHLAIVKNFEALAEGASGAPRVLTPAINDAAVTAIKLAAGSNEVDWVAARTASISNGAVGSYLFLGETSNSTTTAYGATRAGSALRPAGIVGSASFVNTSSGASQYAGQNTALAGTWRCMGVSRANQIGETSGGDPLFGFGATLWLRIS